MLIWPKSGVTSPILGCLASDTSDDPTDVLLVDDPLLWLEIRMLKGDAARKGARTVVVAADLAQLGDTVSDAKLSSFLQGKTVSRFVLRTCYRQLEGPGRQAKHFMDVLANSSPMINGPKQATYAKEHATQLSFLNDIHFVYPGGSALCLELATLADWSKALQRITRPPLWRWSTPIMVVTDSALVCRDAWLSHLARTRVPFRHVSLEEVEAVRGLEFQHVVMLLSSTALKRMAEVPPGSGKGSFAELRMRSRIPPSRAVESLTILGIDDAAVSS